MIKSFKITVSPVSRVSLRTFAIRKERSLFPQKVAAKNTMKATNSVIQEYFSEVLCGKSIRQAATKHTIVRIFIEIKTALFLVLYMITPVFYCNILNRLILFYHIIGKKGEKVQKIR